MVPGRRAGGSVGPTHQAVDEGNAFGINGPRDELRAGMFALAEVGSRAFLRSCTMTPSAKAGRRHKSSRTVHELLSSSGELDPAMRPRLRSPWQEAA